MIQEFTHSVLTAIGSWFGGLFSGLADYAYIGEWWAVAAAILVGCLLVGFFLPWNWARAVLGFIAWTAIVAAWAATRVWLRMRRRAAEKPPEPLPERPEWPWKWPK